MSNYTRIVPHTKEKISPLMMIALIIGAILFLSTLGFMGWVLMTMQTTNSELMQKMSRLQNEYAASPEGSVAGAQTTRTTASTLPAEGEESRRRVESMILLPVKGDIPTFAAIDNMAKIQNENFFRFAQIGDHLFVYPESKLAILFRPSALKIINMSEVNAPQPEKKDTTDATAQSAKPAELGDDDAAEPVKIAIYYGSSDAGIQAQSRAKIDTVKGISIVSEKISPTMLAKTRVVNIAGAQSFVEKLKSALGAEAGELPPDIDAKNAEVVVIFGQ